MTRKQCPCGRVTGLPEGVRARCLCGLPLDDAPLWDGVSSTDYEWTRRIHDPDDWDDDHLPGCGGCH